MSEIVKASGIDVGSRVFLRGARVGAAGVVIRCERGRMVVYCSDLDFVSRHRPGTLMPAQEKGEHDVSSNSGRERHSHE